MDKFALSQGVYNKMLVDKVVSFSEEIIPLKKKYDYDYRAIITRILNIHHGTIPPVKSREIIKHANCLKDLYYKKIFYKLLRKYKSIKYLKSTINYVLFKIDLISIPKNQITIFVHHTKFIHYLSKSGMFDKYKLVWVIFGDVELSSINNSKDKYIKFRNINYSSFNKNFILEYCDYLYESLHFFIQRIKPKAMFVFEGDAPYHVHTANVGKKLGVKTFCFQWGLIHNRAARIRFSNMNFSGFLSWGNFFTKQLKPYNPDQKFYHLGHLNFSITKSSGHSIIFLDQGSSNPQIDQSHFQEYHKIILKFCQNTDHKIIVRPHPNHDLCEVLRENLIQHGVEISNKKTSLSHDLSLSKVAVSIMSSSLLDASINGIIPVSFRYDQMEEYPFPLNQLKIGLESSCPSEIFRFINLIMSQPSLYKEYKERLFKSIQTLFSYNTLSQRKCSLSELLH